MKKFVGILVILLYLMFSISFALADTTACDIGRVDENGVMTLSWNLIDTDPDGIVTGSYCNIIVSGWLYGVRLIPDDTGNLVISGDYQPVDNWDGKVQDQYGYDILEGVGTNVTNLFTTTRQFRTPTTTDSSGNNVGFLYLNGLKLRGYASGLGNYNGCRIEISVKVQDAVRKGR